MNDDTPAILGGPATFAIGPPPWPPERPAVRDALLAAYADGGWGQYHGVRVNDLETRLSVRYRVPHALTCASGTLAVETALRAVGVGPGDEVIMAAYEYESNFLSIIAIGAKPVLIDICETNGNFDPAQLNAARSPATKAVLVSHIHGGFAPIDEVVAWSKNERIAVIEDAAQSPAANDVEIPKAIVADIRTLSFGGSKIVTAGRGGAMLFPNEKPFQRAKLWLNRGVQQWAALSEIQAAVLLPQLDTLTAEVATRLCGMQVFAVNVPGLRMLPGDGLYKIGFEFDAVAFGLSRDLFVKSMRAEGVAFDAGFKALHRSRAPSRFRAIGSLPCASIAHDAIVMLHHPVMLNGHLAGQQVARAIAKTYRNAERIRAEFPPLS